MPASHTTQFISFIVSVSGAKSVIFFRMVKVPPETYAFQVFLDGNTWSVSEHRCNGNAFHGCMNLSSSCLGVH